MIITKIVTRTAPILIGMLNNILSAIAPPSISARDVETDARTAKERIDLILLPAGRLLQLLRDRDRSLFQDVQHYAVRQSTL